MVKVEHPEWALCIGGASCIWDDVLAWETAYGRPWDGLVIAANDVGAHWPRDLHHWVTLHPNKLEKWEALRRQHQMPDSGWQTWCQQSRWTKGKQWTTHAIVPWAGGSSGMLAVQVARALGCTRAVLCGIPMTQTPHFGETTERFHSHWVGANGHWRAWSRHRTNVLGWARSMSGRTQELLGTPTVEWLTSTQEGA